ncbi:MAG: hypothetical protein IAF94_07640 [Pirellulaceae bacterium]|nr:hypothetical protein [Pirellulaceae bacterium]
MGGKIIIDAVMGGRGIKSSRRSTEGKQQTWAGCLVLLVTVLVVFPAVIVFALWVQAIWPQNPPLWELFIAFSVLLGLAVFCGLSAILHALNIPTWQEPPESNVSGEEGEHGRTIPDHPGHSS